MKQVFNPYMPSWEYVPDGEPHVFGDRVYVYGSHDRFNGYAYCLNDYVCYSAPVDDLKSWRYEGIIYRRDADPRNADGEMTLFAPDVAQGPDGRYYLYYVLNALSVVSVAVSDSPAGPYSFLGYVHDKQGRLLGEREGDEHQFDPAVLVEGNTVYLYTGVCGKPDLHRHGPMVTVLNADMLTIEQDPQFIMPSAPYSKGSGFEGFEFFEASSIRKVNQKYYFIYSSVNNHELCYAVSDRPTGGFKYCGVIISNCDMHIDSYKPAAMPAFYGGNDHGSIVQIQDQWYVFHHRHTNGTNFSRQACAEKIAILPDGTIPQVEMTSCGLNGGPLLGKGEYPAYIACNLFGKKECVYTGAPGVWLSADYPRITQEGRDGDENPGYIENVRDGVTVGFKYFECSGITQVGVTVRGYCRDAVMEVKTALDEPPLGSIRLSSSNEWKQYTAAIQIPDGVHALYFVYRGNGNGSFAAFSLQ